MWNLEIKVNYKIIYYLYEYNFLYYYRCKKIIEAGANVIITTKGMDDIA